MRCFHIHSIYPVGILFVLAAKSRAQVLACLAAWQDAQFCSEILGLDAPFGAIAREQLNVDGGAISLGHPVGTSGNRITLHLANALRRLGKRRGIATQCIGGGLGGAMLLEAV